MTDDFDDLSDLKSAMQAATPKPDAQRRAENLARTMENFDALQGSRNGARHTTVQAPKGRATGVWQMLTNILGSKGGLTATTALVACGVLVMTPQGQDLLRAPMGPRMTLTEAPVAMPPAPVMEEKSVVEDRAMAAAPEMMETLAMPAPMVMADQAAPAMALSRAAPQGFEAELFVPELPQVDYANAPSNPLKVTAESPVSTFSIDVDTASYAMVRNALMQGTLPDPDAVRIEEMINYFPYDYPAPAADEAPFRPTISTFQTPWNADTQLVHIALQGQRAEVSARPPLNLVFLIDTSGSMEDPSKLPLLVQSFRLMLGQLRPDDQVAIVTYAGSAGTVLEPTAASDRAAIMRALQQLGAGGGTNGVGGLQEAYALADRMTEEGEVSRVILATDGDFNIGISDPDALKDFIAKQRDSGTYLSVMGFGRNWFDDATMQALAQNGNGIAAYIDTLSEAQKVLVDQLSGALFTIAEDVKVQVEFNPAQIAEYRLIGYETRALNREDFNNDKVDAGELGAGHTVTAIYEVTPVGSPAQLTEPLRYGQSGIASMSDEWGFLRLRYKAPGEEESRMIAAPILPEVEASDDALFAAAIAGFGQLLRDGRYLGDWQFADAIALATQSKGDDPFGYRQESIQLMRLAASLSD